MQSGRANFEGAVTNRLINFYVRRSTHLGLPIVEHSYVSRTGKIGPKQLAIHDDSAIRGFEKLATALHEVGAPAVVQISHAGGVTNKRVIGTEPADPLSKRKNLGCSKQAKSTASQTSLRRRLNAQLKLGSTASNCMAPTATC